MTEAREITPYKWVQPDKEGERRQGRHQTSFHCFSMRSISSIKIFNGKWWCQS